MGVALVASPWFPDHSPIVAWLDAATAATDRRLPGSVAWGRDVLAKGMRTGERRVELHGQIEDELLAQDSLLTPVETGGATDRHYHAVVALVTKVAGSCLRGNVAGLAGMRARRG